jgi:Flp pilus assembly protein TadB
MRSDDGSPMTGEKNSFSAYNDVARLADDTIEVRDRKHPVDDSPSGFLPAADSRVRAATDDFERDLRQQALRIARDRHATVVDVEDVHEAERKLRATNDERRAWHLGVGCLFGGAAAAGLVALAISPTPVGWLVIGLLTVPAVVLIASSYPRRNRR